MAVMLESKKFLQRVRQPAGTVSIRRELLICAVVVLLGFALGVFQKWLDGSAFNELPMIFQRLDITNFFGRFAIWILLAAILSVYAATPFRASLHTFLFFLSMVSGYYFYCSAVLGFFPRSYAMVWVVLSFVSPIPAYFCWYAKGNGVPAIVISAVILGVLFSQAFALTQGFRMLYLPEVITWVIALIVLRREPKGFAVEIVLSLAVALLVQLFFPYWG